VRIPIGQTNHHQTVAEADLGDIDDQTHTLLGEGRHKPLGNGPIPVFHLHRLGSLESAAAD